MQACDRIVSELSVLFLIEQDDYRAVSLWRPLLVHFWRWQILFRLKPDFTTKVKHSCFSRELRTESGDTEKQSKNKTKIKQEGSEMQKMTCAMSNIHFYISIHYRWSHKWDKMWNSVSQTHEVIYCSLKLPVEKLEAGETSLYLT